jgi:hypothetical protein
MTHSMVWREHCLQQQSQLKSLDSEENKLFMIYSIYELSTVGIKYTIQLFNAVFLKGYFPAQWKVEQIVLILKPEKAPNELTSYRPILPVN